jgi:hypothetical protein
MMKLLKYFILVYYIYLLMTFTVSKSRETGNIWYTRRRQEKHRETGNIGYTRRRKTQRNWQYRVHKTKKNFSPSCVPYIASLSVFFSVLCTLYCQSLCVFLRLVYPILPVSLCFSPSCVPYIATEKNTEKLAT